MIFLISVFFLFGCNKKDTCVYNIESKNDMILFYKKFNIYDLKTKVRQNDNYIKKFLCLKGLSEKIPGIDDENIILKQGYICVGINDANATKENSTKVLKLYEYEKKYNLLLLSSLKTGDSY
ncbi:hypothetical protein [Nitratifractor salsuginis]|nr:hypothetical protein [Nitratifractor salsuginis]